MHDWFFSFWWLLFPVGWFLFMGWASWLSYLRRKQELQLLKDYVAQGKEPPPEIARAVGVGGVDPMAPGAAYPYGYAGPWMMRRWWKFSPYWQWQRAIGCGAVAGGLYYYANYVSDDPHLSRGLMIAAVVFGVMAAGALLTALMFTINPPK